MKILLGETPQKLSHLQGTTLLAENTLSFLLIKT